LILSGLVAAWAILWSGIEAEPSLKWYDRAIRTLGGVIIFLFFLIEVLPTNVE
jgi:hypothetical protein